MSLTKQTEDSIDVSLQRQFITLSVAGEEYGVDLMSVREIKGWVTPTRIPNSPAHMRGVINLRGIIIPVFDLRSRFSMGETQITKNHVILIVAIMGREIGILVDAVSDILSLNPSDIQPIPEMENVIDADFLLGLVSVDERMVSILDLEKLFDVGELPAG